MNRPVFRFAPSPNGELHLGHALSALLNADMARQAKGRLLLRIEDIDLDRCTPAFEQGIRDDLAWIGVSFEEPVRRQSDHFADYKAALERLREMGLLYPAFMSRGEIRSHIAAHEADHGPWPRDPDGAPLYPGLDRKLDAGEQRTRMESGEPYAWRLHMELALENLAKPLTWQETGSGPAGEAGPIIADPAAWGDVVLARKDVPASYHLCVTMDDAVQGVTHVVRGRDLFHATSIHRLLQELLGLGEPAYHHHRLILGQDGRKLSKSLKDTSLAALRASGMTPDRIRHLAGMQADVGNRAKPGQPTR